MTGRPWAPVPPITKIVEVVWDGMMAPHVGVRLNELAGCERRGFFGFDIVSDIILHSNYYNDTYPEPSVKIKDAVVLVTGANRGLGQAFVHSLLAAGAKKIYAAARKPEVHGHRCQPRGVAGDGGETRNGLTASEAP